MRIIEKITGALFLLAFVCYGVGFSLISTVVRQVKILSQVDLYISASGTLLMIFNSACVIGIGLLSYRMLAGYNKLTAQIYLLARIIEGALLAIGAILLYASTYTAYKIKEFDDNLPIIIATLSEQYNFVFYQIAMLTLGMGSISFCIILLKFGLAPKFICMLGIIGYIFLLIGSIAELYKIETGIYCSIPGGLFEMLFAYWLIFKGLKHNKY